MPRVVSLAVADHAGPFGRVDPVWFLRVPLCECLPEPAWWVRELGFGEYKAMVAMLDACGA